MKPTRTRNRISVATYAGDRRSPAAWAGSLALHGAIVVATLFTFSHTLEIADQSPPVIPVDVVTITQKTNIRAMAHHEPKIAPEPTPPVPKVMPPPPVPPQKAEPAPENPPVPKAEPLKETPPAPVVRSKPQPTPKKEEKKNFDVDKVLALLNKVAPAQSAAPDAPEAPRTVRGFGAQTAMTADLVDALRSQIQPCWSPPVGASHSVIVDFDLFLNPDGSVARPPQLLENSGDPYFHAYAEAARRAIFTCAPYHLPADRYSEWREISDFRFDPRAMMGEQ